MDLIEMLRECYDRCGKIPTRAEFTSTCGISKRKINNEFGTYTNFIIAAGLREERTLREFECAGCGKCFTSKEKLGYERVFCSKKCSVDDLNSKPKDENVKIAISNGIKKSLLGRGYLVADGEYTKVYLNVCKVCNDQFYFYRKRKTCSSECLSVHNMDSSKKAGKESAAKRVVRSKNEIGLCNKLSEILDVEHNIPMFDGWDADIICRDLKIAILWNGPWHYKKITKTHSLKQVQCRDEIKIKAILDFGYTPIIIKDFENDMSIQKAFEQIVYVIKYDGSLNGAIYIQ